MILYRRKYNSKFKHETRPWYKLDLLKTNISLVDWQIYEFRLNGVIYASPSQAFIEEYNKIMMWRKLSDT